VLAQYLPDKPTGRCIVVGAGKSAALMAACVEQAWPDVDLSGTVVTRYGHAVPTSRITVLQAAHPVPDQNSELAARQILAAVRDLGPDDLVLALISGGGSALMALPAPGITLADKQAVNRALLQSGASISEMNAVRRHLSAIKGGRLAIAAAPAKVVTLAISDVPGDLPAVIASGPTIPEPTSRAQVMDILRHRRISLPENALRILQADMPLPAPAVDFRLIATPALALRAAARMAEEAGLRVVTLGDALEGESREAGKIIAGIALSCQTHALPAAPPAILLSGGETTVTVGTATPGKGGRNTEFLLAAALQLAGRAGIYGLAADTDGIDGSEDAAGAVITPSTLARAASAGLDPAAMLHAHDSYSLFAALGDLVMTGPTLTNVNDFRAVLIA
jgi:hydroxypyruvate reductase